MRPDPSVISAMEAAVEKDPSNAALRLHLAALLLDAEEAAKSLEHCTLLLQINPANREVLDIAAKAAEATGDKIRADGYKKLHEALGWSTAQSLIESAPLPEPTPARRYEPNPFDDDDEDEDDEDSDDLRQRLKHYERVEQEALWEDATEMDRPAVRLSDVAGLEEVKKRLELSLLAPMRNPDMRKLYGKSLRGGLLLYGPPGCGKTFIARAIAGELGARFLALDLTDVIDMYIGQSEKNLHGLFQAARKHSPCVIFIDEIDALGRKRSLQRDHAGRNIVNQLLAELDGSQRENEGVYVLAATNHPWDVDSALRRPGRLDRTVLVLPPDKPARAAIVTTCLQDRPAEKIDAEWIAEHTEDFSGADIAHLCESAVEYAMEDSISSGITRPVRMNDFKRALKDVRPSIRPWLETARNHVLYANESGTYDQLGEYLKRRKIL